MAEEPTKTPLIEFSRSDALFRGSLCSQYEVSSIRYEDCTVSKRDSPGVWTPLKKT